MQLEQIAKKQRIVNHPDSKLQHAERSESHLSVGCLRLRFNHHRMTLTLWNHFMESFVQENHASLKKHHLRSPLLPLSSHVTLEPHPLTSGPPSWRCRCPLAPDVLSRRHRSGRPGSASSPPRQGQPGNRHKEDPTSPTKTTPAPICLNDSVLHIDLSGLAENIP